MTTRTALFIAFMAGMLAFAVLGTMKGTGLPRAEKEAISVRQGSAHRTTRRRHGRFWFYHRWGK